LLVHRSPMTGSAHGLRFSTETWFRTDWFGINRFWPPSDNAGTFLL
jgi:hypothetical protein